MAACYGLDLRSPAVLSPLRILVINRSYEAGEGGGASLAENASGAPAVRQRAPACASSCRCNDCLPPARPWMLADGGSDAAVSSFPVAVACQWALGACSCVAAACLAKVQLAMGCHPSAVR